VPVPDRDAAELEVEVGGLVVGLQVAPDGFEVDLAQAAQDGHMRFGDAHARRQEHGRHRTSGHLLILLVVNWHSLLFVLDGLL
jgi:hypothetical protein